MFSSLSSFYDNIRSYSLTGKKPGDKRQRDREDDDVIITDVLQTPPAKRLRNIEKAACESGDNSPILNFSEFVKKVTWSGRYIWNYVVRGETGCDNSESSLSRDLGDAEEEMEKFQSSADMGLISGSTGTRDSGLMRKPLIKHSGHEVTVRTRSAGKREWHVSASPKRNRKNLAVGSGKVYDASKYKDVSSSKANGSLGSSNVRKGTSWNLPESPQPSISSSRKKGHAQSGKTPLSKSPINRSGRFISTAERVVRLEERDRYKQLVAQFTTQGTPDCTFNTRSDNNLHVHTDFLTRTRYNTRSGDGSLLSPKSKLPTSRDSITAPASPPKSPTRLRVMASPRTSANRSRKLAQDVSLYSRPGPIEEVSSPSRNLRSSTRGKSMAGNILDEEWTKKWKDILSEDSLTRQRDIAKEERKLKAIKQKREEEAQALEDEVQKRLLKGWDTVEEVEEEEVTEEADSFVALSSDMEQMVDAALSPGNADDPIVEGFQVTLKRSDLATLSTLNWLNDEIMNFYFHLLVERSRREGNLKIHAFNSFFYPKLIKSGYKSLRRWTKKIDIFAMDMVLVPVHLGMHWCLAAIDFNKRCITYYDSLKGSNPQCLTALRAYLNDESLDKKKMPFDLSEWKLAAPKDIPEQLNGCDCGVFACKYAEYLSRGAKFDFDQRDIPYFRRRMVYEILSKNLL